MGNNQSTGSLSTQLSLTYGGGPFASSATKKRARLAHELDQHCQASLSSENSTTSSSSSSSVFRDIFTNRRGSQSNNIDIDNLTIVHHYLQRQNNDNTNDNNNAQQQHYRYFIFPSKSKSHWDENRIRRAIVEGKLAPLYKGLDYDYDGTSECPICFLNYPSLNSTNCCRNIICSTCFLQLRPVQNNISCPFCKHLKFDVKYLNSDVTSEDSIQAELKALETYKRIRETILMEENDTLFQQNLNRVYVTGLAEMPSVQERISVEDEKRRQEEIMKEQRQKQENQRNRYRERIQLQQSQLRGIRGRRHRNGSIDNDNVLDDSAIANIIVRGRNGARRQMLMREGDLNQIEELMILQAMQMSLEDSGSGGGDDTTATNNETNSEEEKGGEERRGNRDSDNHNRDNRTRSTNGNGSALTNNNDNIIEPRGSSSSTTSSLAQRLQSHITNQDLNSSLTRTTFDPQSFILNDREDEDLQLALALSLNTDNEDDGNSNIRGSESNDNETNTITTTTGTTNIDTTITSNNTAVNNISATESPTSSRLEDR